MRGKAVRRALLAASVWAFASFQANAQDAPEPLQRVAPKGAPNVVVILLDDVGFGASEVFGGPVRTPTLSALSSQGLRYTRFHTTGICSPTRASLLTGRNPHNTGIGAVMNTPDPRPGYNGFHTKDTATIATMLRQRGYSTAAFGKWHQVPNWEASPIGPFDRWPTGEGFDTFYGFIGGETSQYEPTLIEGTTPVVRPAGENYHLTEDLAERATKWMRLQNSITPDRPFFLYFSTGGAHAPLQVSTSWSDKYKGKFDSGWDALREEIFARQKASGTIPAHAVLTPRPEGMPAWDTLTDQQKRFAARTMEVYAGFLEHTDAQVSKLMDAIATAGEADNTLVFYVFGDNGGSAEGGLFGSLNYFADSHGEEETDEYRAKHIDKFGTDHGNSHYAAGWAWATNAPYRWTKTVASHLGGTRNAMVVSWPSRVAGAGSVRAQFGHVNDIAPTILEATGIEFPKVVDGIAQKPFDGSSMLKTITSTNAPEYHPTQYFEVFGHRAIYHQGWMASAFHARLPWKMRGTSDKKCEDDHWELFDLEADPTQSRDISQEHPARTKAMKALFEAEAHKNRVLPLQNYSYAEGAKLPQLSSGRTTVTYHEGAVGIPESALPKTFGRSWSATAQVRVEAGAQGVIAAVGGMSAGWSLYLDAKGCPTFAYRVFAMDQHLLTCDTPLAPGDHTIKLASAFEGPDNGGAATLRLFVDDKLVDERPVPLTAKSLYTIDETFDVGIDRGSPVGTYPTDGGIGFPFRGGSIAGVTIAGQ